MDTEPSLERLLELFNSGVLAEEMAGQFGLEDPINIAAVVEHCAQLHNFHLIDLFQLVENETIQQLSGFKFFSATNFLCRILPKLEASPERMMSCIETLVRHGGEDMVANQPNAAFREWCVNRPDRARDVINSATNGDALASQHLTFALEALSDTAGARQIALSFRDGRRLSAITALGRINDPDLASCLETLKTFEELLEGQPDDDVRGCALLAIVSILARRSDIDQILVVRLLKSLVNDGGKITLHQAAYAIWMIPAYAHAEIVQCLLEALANVDPANKGTLDYLDHGLQKLMSTSHDSAAISFVTKLLSAREGVVSLEAFDGFMSALISGPSARLSRVIVEWLTLSIPSLCLGLENALRGHTMEGPTLDLRAEDLAIPAANQVFLCRKAIGWFFTKPKTAASILVSVLRVCDTETAKMVENLLAEILLLNWGCVRDYLESLNPEDPAKPAADRSLARNTIYLDGLRNVPTIKEFEPSESRRRIQQTREREQMRNATKSAQDQSIFRQICKTAFLLYGNRALSFVREDGGQLRPVEMDMKNFGVTFETPRMSIIDPVWLEYTLRVFQVERLAS